MKRAFEILEDVPDDRLDCLSKSVKIRDIILNCLAALNDISDIYGAMKFTDSDLVVIRGHFSESARPLIELMDYFLSRAEKMADTNPFAV